MNMDDIKADLNRMLMEMYDKGIADAETAAIAAIEVAIREERERCAKVCEELARPAEEKMMTDFQWASSSCAAAIRSMK